MIVQTNKATAPAIAGAAGAAVNAIHHHPGEEFGRPVRKAVKPRSQ
jgi:hypothetical protein